MYCCCYDIVLGAGEGSQGSNLQSCSARPCVANEGSISM